MTEQKTLLGLNVVIDNTIPVGTVRFCSETEGQLKSLVEIKNISPSPVVLDGEMPEWAIHWGDLAEALASIKKENEWAHSVLSSHIEQCLNVMPATSVDGETTTTSEETSSSVVDGEVLEWTDTQEIRFDTSVHFGKGYDFFPWEYLRHELHTPLGSYAVWGRDSKWSVYGTKDGWMALDHFASEREARTAAEKSYLSDRVEQLKRELANSSPSTPPIGREMPEWVKEWIEEHRSIGEGSDNSSMTTDVVVWLADQLEAREVEIAALSEQKDGAYSERQKLVYVLARLAAMAGWKVGIKRTEIEGWDPAWHNCIYIDGPTGQLSWHYHDSESYLFDFHPAYEGEWDGHTTDQKYDRVVSLSGSTFLGPMYDSLKSQLASAQEDSKRIDKAEKLLRQGYSISLVNILQSDLRRLLDSVEYADSKPESESTVEEDANTYCRCAGIYVPKCAYCLSMQSSAEGK